MLTSLRMSREQTWWQAKWQITNHVRYHVWHYLIAEEELQISTDIRFLCRYQVQQEIVDRVPLGANLFWGLPHSVST